MRFNRLAAAAALGALAAACATTEQPAIVDDHRLDAFTETTLVRFESDRAFADYLQDVRDETRARAERIRAARKAKQDSEPPCDPSIQNCEEEDRIVVTGSRIQSAPAASAATPVQAVTSSNPAAPNVTNVQVAQVDEGDIVKQIGQYLISLQDGRLFVIDTRAEAGLALVDRQNVYRHAEDDSWYDEMLVHDRRIVVTGYSYDQNATAFYVFALSQAGLLTREATYYLSSNDYYDIENYAARLVDGNLVIHTPMELTGYWGNRENPEFPRVRRWLREEDREAVLSEGRRLYDAREIYRPIQRTLEPTIHTVSICPLGTADAGDELDCTSTAIIAPRGNAFYVSPTHFYLWAFSDNDEAFQNAYDEARCAPDHATQFRNAVPAALFRIPLNGDAPRAMLTRGAPMDQFALDATDDEFRALLVWSAPECVNEENPLELRYFRAPQAAFRDTPLRMSENNFTPVPSPKTSYFENRFTGDYVVYGGRDGWSSRVPEGANALTATVIAVPVAHPDRPVQLTAPHNVIRVERIGNDAVLTGYANRGGLSITHIDLDGAPRIASTMRLDNRFESEGRSHAFNYTLNSDGTAYLGIPTVTMERDSYREWYRSRTSDISFINLGADGRLSSLGALHAAENPIDPTYECEVSCVDWYGNARPIFTLNRIFALTNGELIEGEIRNAQIQELRRLNLTAPPPRRPDDPADIAQR